MHLMRPGPRNLITDVTGVSVGNATDAELKSGVTVLTSDRPFTAGVDVRGGAPGTRETDLLAPGRLVQGVDALVLSGGSAFGLEAASGVAEALRRKGRGFRLGAVVVPIVPAAILFDLANGGEKAWEQNPYAALGRTALEAASEAFAIGSVGAGTGALTATWKGGLGSASFVLPRGVTVGAVVAANPTGAVTPPGERRFWAAPWEVDGEFGGLGAATAPIEAFTARRQKPEPGAALANTTIAIVATDATLDQTQARRMAEAAHDGMARAIAPAHTPFDGDLVFAAATGRRDVAGGVTPDVEMEIGHAGAVTLARAIARAVYSATPAPGDVARCWAQEEA